MDVYFLILQRTIDDDDDSDDFFASDSDDSSSEDELPEGGRKQWGAWMFLKDTTYVDNTTNLLLSKILQEDS